MPAERRYEADGPPLPAVTVGRVRVSDMVCTGKVGSGLNAEDSREASWILRSQSGPDSATTVASREGLQG